jgi:hypothetical protein
MGDTTGSTVTIDDGSTWRVDGPLKDVLTAFNGGNPLNLVSAVKTTLADGFTVKAQTSFMGDAQASLSATIKHNGDITLLVSVASVQLTHLLGASHGLTMLAGFDVTMPETTVLIQRTGGELSLNAACKMGSAGTLCFVANQAPAWEVAAGLWLNVPTIAAIPGLHGSKLALFDQFVGLTDIVMIIASQANAHFDFPDLDSFTTPTLGSGKLVLPKQSAGGLVQGLNIYAGLSTTSGGGFRSIAKFLKLQLDGSIGMTLAVSLPDPATNSKFFLSVQELIKPGVNLTGELGFVLAGSDVGVFMTGELAAPIQGQPATFDVTVLVVENGVLFSGSMRNTAPLSFTIDHVRFHLANVGLVIGIDGEGIPSFGFCATIDINRFNAAIAVFIDSVDPAKSMFAGAVSDLTLLDVIEVMANQTNLPAPLAEVFDAFGLKSLQAFTLPLTIAHALDQRDLHSIANAFAQHQVTIPNTSDQVLLDVNTAGQLWYLTDLKTMNHYILKKTNNAVQVSLEAQLYVVPQATQIGAITFPQGYKVMGQLDLLLVDAAIDIEIQGLSGISADVYVEPIVIINKDFLSITGAHGVGGPYVSLATYSRPQEPDPHFRAPHFAMSGELRLLGCDVASVYMNFSKAGIVFDLEAYVTPLVKIDLNGNIQSARNLRLGGSVQIGINSNIDLGRLGHLFIRADAHGSLNIGVQNGTAFARFQAGLDFESWHLQTPVLSLSINGAALAHLPELLLQELEHLLIDGLLKDVTRFLTWVKNGVLLGLEDVGKLAQVLKTDFKLAAAEAGKLLHEFGHDIHAIAAALKNVFGQAAHDIADIFKNVLGLHSDVINGALKAAGFAAHEVEDAVSKAFDWAASKLNPSHW